MNFKKQISLIALCFVLACGKKDKGGPASDSPTPPSLAQAQKDFAEGAKTQEIWLDVYENRIEANADGDILSSVTELNREQKNDSPAISAQKKLDLNKFIVASNPGISLLIPRYSSLRAHVSSFSFIVSGKNTKNEYAAREYLNAESLELLDYKDNQLEIRISGKKIKDAILEMKNEGLSITEVEIFIDSNEKSKQGDWFMPVFQVWIESN